MPRNRRTIFILAAICLIAVALIDSGTGPEVSFAAFYLIPVVIAAWFSTAAAGILFAIISSIASAIVELNFGREYRHPWVPYINGFLQLAIALFSALVIAAVKDRERAFREETEGRKQAELELALERSLAEAVESEQRRIGMDIHDGLGQHLVSMGFAASMLKTRLEEKSLPEVNDAEEISGLITEAIAQSRRLSRGLLPAKLEAEGLISALEELAESVSAHSKIVCKLETNIDQLDCDAATGSNIFRIAQEAVNNAVKHGEPKSITIRLRQSPSDLAMTISNDGREYVEQLTHARGMGLRIMEYRAKIIGASLQIVGLSGGGAKVSVVLPSRESIK